VTFSSDGVAFAGGSNIALSNGAATFNFRRLLALGVHTLTASFTPGSTSNLDASSTALSVYVYSGTPTFVSFTEDNHVYDGNPHGASCTWNPPIPTTVYYSLVGSDTESLTPPTLPGTYYAYCYANSPDYTSIEATLMVHIYSLPATVTISSLSVPFGSSVPAPTVTTSPAGLSTTVYYNGSTTPQRQWAYIR
jgi:hypothetical protein